MPPRHAPTPRPESAPESHPSARTPNSSTPNGPSRRHALAAGAGLAGAAVAGGVLAACSTSKTNGPRNSTPPVTTPTGSPAGSTGATSDGPIAKLDDITVGGAVSAKLADGSPVIVARPTATTAACFSAICTHQGCTVQPKSTLIQCPCHGSQYDLTTGEVKRGPAPRALPPVAVTVQNGEVIPAS